MVIRIRATNWLLLSLAALATAAGCCCQAIPIPGEHDCPTDARRLYCGFGEEAVRRGPSGPSSQFYGHKPTCWREWPQGWHCYGMPCDDPSACMQPVVMGEEIVQEEMATPVDAASSAHPVPSTPALNRPGAAELPVPPQATPPAPADPIPMEATPPEPMTWSAPTKKNPANESRATQPATLEKQSPALFTGTRPEMYLAEPSLEEQSLAIPSAIDSPVLSAFVMKEIQGETPQSNQRVVRLPKIEHKDESPQINRVEQHIQNNLKL